jgi:hypothetical protein
MKLRHTIKLFLTLVSLWLVVVTLHETHAGDGIENVEKTLHSIECNEEECEEVTYKLVEEDLLGVKEITSEEEEVGTFEEIDESNEDKEIYPDVALEGVDLEDTATNEPEDSEDVSGSNVIEVEDFVHLQSILHNGFRETSAFSDVPITLQFQENFHLEAALDLDNLGGQDLILRGAPDTGTTITNVPGSYFKKAGKIRVENMTFSGAQTTSGIIVAASETVFHDTTWNLTTAGWIIFNDVSTDVQFTGVTNVTTPTGTATITSPVTARNVTIDGTMTLNITATGGAAPLFSIGDKFKQLPGSTLNVTRTGGTGTGAVLHLREVGTHAIMGQGANANVTLSGARTFLTTVDQHTGRFLMEAGATFSGTLPGGLSGNTATTVGHIHLEAGAELSIGGGAGTTPSINARLSVTTAEVPVGEGSPTRLIGNRRTGTGAFIQLQAANSIVRFGERTQVDITDGHPGMIVLGLGTTEVIISRGVVINAVMGLGFTGTSTEASAVLQRIVIEADASLNLRQNTATAVPFFRVAQEFDMEGSASLTARRGTTEDNNNQTQLSSLIQTMQPNATIRIGSLDVIQVGSIVSGNTEASVGTAQTTDVTVSAGAQWTVATGRAISGGGTGVLEASLGNVMRSFRIEDNVTMSLNRHPGTVAANNEDQARFRVRNQFTIGNHVTIVSSRASHHNEPFTAANNGALNHSNAFIYFTHSGSNFQMGQNSTLTVNQIGRVLQSGGAGGTTATIGEGSVIHANTLQGLTGNNPEHRLNTLTLQKEAQLHLRQPISGTFYNTGAGTRQEAIWLNGNLTLGEGAQLTARRNQTAFTTVADHARAALIRIENANATVRLGRNSLMDLNQRGGFFRLENNLNGRLILEEGATFKGTTNTGLTVSDGENFRRTFMEIFIEPDAEFILTDQREAPYNGNNSAVIIAGSDLIRTTHMHIAEGGRFEAYQATNKPSLIRFGGTNPRLDVNEGGTFSAVAAGTGNAVIRFQTANAQLNIHDNGIFKAIATGNVDAVIRFDGQSSSFTINNANYVEIRHPIARSGASNAPTNTQRLIRSITNTVAAGVSIHVNAQSVQLWTGANTDANLGRAPLETWRNITSTLRINRNGGVANDANHGSDLHNGAIGTAEFASRFMTVQGAPQIAVTPTGVIGTPQSIENETLFHHAIARNNYTRLVFSQVDGLLAVLDPLSDQRTSIRGYMFEHAEVAKFTYTNTDGELVEINLHDVTKNGRRMIIWENNWRENEAYRYFYIELEDDERIVAGRNVDVFMTHEGYTDYEMSVPVIKGVNYNAFNFTLEIPTALSITDTSEFHQLLIERAHASAYDVLTNLDLTGAINVVGGEILTITDFSDPNVEGLYDVVFEVGNHAWQFSVTINLTGHAHLLDLTIPMEMFFELRGPDLGHGNRVFASNDYEIINHSPIDVDIFMNRLEIIDDSGIHLLETGEDPLDWSTTSILDDINAPLLELYLHNSLALDIRLYENRAESILMRLKPGASEAISLRGSFFGPYPGFYTVPGSDNMIGHHPFLKPNYNIVFRFVPVP